MGYNMSMDKKTIILAALAVVVIMNKRIEGIDAYQKTIIQLLSAGMAMIPYLLVTGGFDGIRLDAGSIGLLTVIGLVHTGIAYVLYFGSIDGMRAQSIAIFSYMIRFRRCCFPRCC